MLLHRCRPNMGRTSYHVTVVRVTCCFPVHFSQSILPGPDLFWWPHCLHMLLAATANTWGGGGVNKGDTCRRNTCVPGPRCRSCEGCKNRASMCRPFRKCLAVMGLALSGFRIQLAKNLLGTALVAFRQVEDVHIMTGRRSEERSCISVHMSALQVEKRPSISFREVL